MESCWHRSHLHCEISLSSLEILVQDAVLPRDFVITPVRIPDGVGITVAFVGPSPLLDDYERTPGHSYFPRFLNLPPDWNGPDAPFDPTQAVGRDWILDGDSAVLSVPSAIIPEERNYVHNVGHPDFNRIEFLRSKPFRFDPRLKPK